MSRAARICAISAAPSNSTIFAAPVVPEVIRSTRFSHCSGTNADAAGKTGGSTGSAVNCRSGDTAATAPAAESALPCASSGADASSRSGAWPAISAPQKAIAHCGQFGRWMPTGPSGSMAKLAAACRARRQSSS